MKYYCINLKKSIDRRENMEIQFKRENLDVEFIEAVDGRELRIQPENNITVGDFSCASSHRKIYTKIIEEGHPMSIVFEDQCRLAEGFTNFVSKLKFPDRWDIIYLGYTGQRFIENENEHLEKGKPLGTWCYIVSLEGAKKLVTLDPHDFWLIPDVQLSFLPISTFYVKTKIAWRNDRCKSITGSNYVKRGVIKWMIIGHWLVHAFQFWYILEIIWILLILILISKLRISIR